MASAKAHRDAVFMSASSGQIGYAEYGAVGRRKPTAAAVIYLHGLPGCRLEASLWDREATKLGIRFIAPDRPGIGLSARKPGPPVRLLTDYPAQIAELARHLGLSDYYILGLSGGGPHALACAAAGLPGLRGVGVVAGLGPRDLTQEGMGIVQRLSFRAMDWAPRRVVGWLWDVMVGRMARNEDTDVLDRAMRKGLGAIRGPDAEIYGGEDGEVVAQGMVDSLRGAFAQGSDGYVDDATVVTKQWGFGLDEVRVAVRLWYGGKDDLAPAAVGRALAERMDGAEITVYEGETHLSTVVRHREEILRTLCRIVAKEEA